jgi:uncharacterized protein with GYD domain
MIVSKHTAEMCPGGIVRPDKDSFRKIGDAFKESGVKLIEAYHNGPGHEFYFVIEADTNEALNNAVEPLRITGDVRIVPVMRFSDEAARAKRLGIQK